MEPAKRIENIAKKFDLILNFKPAYLELSKQEIIARNLFGDCPDPIYMKYKKKYKKNEEKGILEYLSSEDFKKELSLPQACMVSREEFVQELKLIPKIKNPNFKKEIKGIYSKIKKALGKNNRITLVWRTSAKEAKEYNRDEIMLHEFVHELLEENKIRPKSWRWNEGLVTYITHQEVGKLYRITELPRKKQHQMWYVYQSYARKWLKILSKVENPKRRKELILKKIKSLNE